MENKLITKQFTVDEVSLEEGSREVVCVISSDSVDKDFEVLLPQGLDKKNYAGNPVVMVNHDYSKLPVGSARWIKRDGNKIIAKWYCSDKTELARDVFALLQDKVLRAFSVGFSFDPEKSGPPTPNELKKNPHWQNARRVFRKWSLHEFSVVSVPANQDALALAVSKGLSPETVKFLGDDFKPAPDVFKFSDEVEEPQEEQVVELPLPKFFKKYDPNAIIKSMDIENEIIQRLMGRP